MLWNKLSQCPKLFLWPKKYSCSFNRSFSLQTCNRRWPRQERHPTLQCCSFPSCAGKGTIPSPLPFSWEGTVSPHPRFKQAGSSLRGSLTIIWISLLHTWRSYSLLTNMRFKAHFIPLLVLTRNTIANPPVRETNIQVLLSHVGKVNDFWWLLSLLVVLMPLSTTLGMGLALKAILDSRDSEAIGWVAKWEKLFLNTNLRRKEQ